MTQDELDALPETGAIGQQKVTRDGQCVTVPTLSAVALYHGPDDPMLIHDRHGVAWSVGQAGGVRFKRKIRGQLKQASP